MFEADGDTLRDAMAYISKAARPAIAQEPWGCILQEIDYAHHHGWPLESQQRLVRMAEAQKKSPRAALQQPPRFPTMLRKMWSGAEVQAWIDEHWHSAPAAVPTIPPVLVRDAAKALGCTESDVSRELVKLGRPPRSTNMAISGEELEALAGVLRPAAPAIPSGWTLTLDGQHIKLTSPESRWWDFGPNTDGPVRLVWELLSAMRDGAPAQKGEKP
jgi:hypothetical protein